VSRVLHPARHIGHFRDESFQAITCTTDTDNWKQTKESTPKVQKTQNTCKQAGPM